MKRLRCALVALAAVLAVAACSGRTETIVVSGGTGGAPAGGTGGGGGLDGGSATGGSAGLAAFCPTGPGPEMVAVQTPKGWYCIDSTEITEHQYADFLDQTPTLDAQPAFCKWNESYEGETTTPRSLYPRRWVDWCDGHAYCQWAGKRLCGAIGGGSADYAKFASASESEWYFACSRGGERVYPYGDTFQPFSCSTSEYPVPPAKLHMVASGGCEGGFVDIFDMSGNLAEWEDSCTEWTGPVDKCRARGGSWKGGQEAARCQSGGYSNRGQTDEVTGFRCCADAVPQE